MNSSTEDSSQDTQESGSAGPDQRQFETTLEDIKALRQQSVEGLQQQLQRTFEDLRTLGVQVGAVSPDQKLRVASKTQILISAAVLLAISVAVAWFVWVQWHTVVAALGPLGVIASHSWRWRRADQEAGRNSGSISSPGLVAPAQPFAAVGGPLLNSNSIFGNL